MHLVQQFLFLSGAILGLIAFVIGAFGSHKLKSVRSPTDLQIFEIGVRYQMYHALALIGLSANVKFFPSPFIIATGWLFLFGSLIFSGSLYMLVASGRRKWGMVTPIGGVILLLGWVCLVLGGIL